MTVNYEAGGKGRVRRATKEDLGNILNIERNSFENPWSGSRFHHLLTRKISFVYEEKRNILGFIIAGEERVDAGGVPRFSEEGEINEQLHILNLAVIPHRRRQGIGTQLLNKLETYCEENNLKTVGLEVRESNNTANQFYKSCGFNSKRILPFYYENGENALFMRKKI